MIVEKRRKRSLPPSQGIPEANPSTPSRTWAPLIDRGRPLVDLLSRRSSLRLMLDAYLVILILLVAFRALTLIVYLLILTATLAAARLPTRWGLAVVLGFAGLAGILKDIADYSPVAHLANDFVIGGLFVGHLVRAAAGSQPLLPRRMPLRLPLGLLLFAMIALAPTAPTILAIGAWKTYLEPALLVPVAAVALAVPGSLRPVIWALIGVGAANAAAALYEIRLGPSMIDTWGPGFHHTVTGAVIFFRKGGGGHGAWKPFGLAQDNGAAAFLAAISALLLVLRAFNRGASVWARLAAVTMVPMTLLAVFLIGVRTAEIALVLALVVGLALTQIQGRVTRRTLIRSAALLGGLAALIAGIGFYVYGVSDAQQERIHGLLTIYTLPGRDQLLHYLVSTLTTTPLGAGLGTTIPGNELLTRLGNLPPRSFANENMMLDLTVELGWLGLGVGVLLVLEVVRSGYRSLSSPARSGETDLALTVCLAMLVISFAGPVLDSQPGNLVFWVFAAALGTRVLRSPAGPGLGV